MNDTVRVLHVDDDQSFRNLTTEFLTRESDRIEVISEPSATAALNRLDGADVDCIVSDFDMPGANGLEFLESVRADYPDVPFVLFTGKGSEEVAADAISAGVTDYFQKRSGREQYSLLAQRIESAVERRRTEVELDGTRRRFRKLIEHSVDIIVVIDTDFTFSYVSPSIEPILGFDPAATVGDDALEYVHPDDIAVSEERLAEAIADPTIEVTEEIRLATADGSWQWLEARARNHIDDPDIGGVVIYARDITDRKARKEELRHYEAIVENITDIVYTVDDSWTITHVNPAVADYVDMQPSDIVGDSVEAYLDEMLGADDRERFRAALSATLAGEDERLDVDIQLPTGTVVLELEMTPLPPDDDADPATSDGAVIISRDVTERRADERRLERQNERLDEFARIVSHDLRNPIDVASLRLELLQEEVDSEHVPPIATALQRMESLVEDVLSLAREGTAVRDPHPVSLSTAAVTAWATVETGDAHLVTETDREILAEDTRLSQLLENLFRNAVEHGSTSPRSTSSHEDAVEHGSTSSRTESDDAVEHGSTGPDAGTLTVTVGDLEDGFYVADDGVGIPAEAYDQVFDPGYSTSEDGTGFGLEIVQALAEAHGWSVSVTDSADGGAQFEIRGVEEA